MLFLTAYNYTCLKCSFRFIFVSYAFCCSHAFDVKSILRTLVPVNFNGLIKGERKQFDELLELLFNINFIALLLLLEITLCPIALLFFNVLCEMCSKPCLQFFSQTIKGSNHFSTLIGTGVDLNLVLTFIVLNILISCNS